jgi:2-oxoglutarate ferredoxin oxidoreductase subunit alpha
MRVRGFPFGDDVRAFLAAHETTFVVEQNRDAQLRSLLLLETGVAPATLESVRYYGGFPMSAHHVTSGVKARLEKAA